MLKHDGTVVHDSWAIAVYLEERFPDRPSLFGDAIGQAHALFINSWADVVLQPAVGRLIVLDVWSALHPDDQAYFRKTREARYGGTLEAVQKGRERRVAEVRALFKPVELVLEHEEWLGGDAPSYADYIVLGTLQFARCMSKFDILGSDGPVVEWFDRALGLFDDLALRAPRAVT